MSSSIEASVTPWNKLSRSLRREAVTDANWQAKVRRYDAEGPGIVGASLDLPAATAMLLELCVQRKGVKGWETVDDDPLLSAVLDAWQGASLDQSTLFARTVRMLDSVGEGYLIAHKDEHGFWWQLAPSHTVTDNKDGSFTVVDRPGLRHGDPGRFTLPNRSLFWFHQEDPNWPGTAWSPQRRGLPHIEAYRQAQRNIGRGLDSQLAMNGILWAKSVSAKSGWQDNVAAWARNSISKDEGIEQVMPFLAETAEKPEWIDVGRSDFDDQIKAADEFLMAYARASDIPTNMLIEGPAQGKFWNSFLEGDFYADYVMRPRWMRAANLVTETHLRPFIRALPDSEGYDADDFRVWASDSAIRSKTDNSEQVLELRRMGIASREAAAQAAGLSPDDMMPLPPGVSDWESWAVSRSPGLAAREPKGVENLVGPVLEFEDSGSDGIPALPAQIEAQAEVDARAGEAFDFWPDLVA